LWSPKARKSEAKGKRVKTIRISLGCDFKLKDIVDMAIGSHTFSCHTLDFLDLSRSQRRFGGLLGLK
jgi:hypothetical protein